MKFKIKYYQLELNETNKDYTITSPDNIYNMVKNDYDPLCEIMIIIGMNIKNEILKKQVSQGSYNSLICTPKDIFIPLLLSNCHNYVIIHSHLSEDNTPSKEDIIFTKKIKSASDIIGLNLLDHVIITSKDYYSFKSNSLL